MLPVRFELSKEELREVVQELECQQERAQQLSLDDLQVSSTATAGTSGSSPSSLAPSTGLENAATEKMSPTQHYAPAASSSPSSHDRANRSTPSVHTPWTPPHHTAEEMPSGENAPYSGGGGGGGSAGLQLPTARVSDSSVCLLTSLDDSTAGGGGGLNEGFLEGRIGGILMQRLERRKKQFLQNQEKLRKEAERKLQVIPLFRPKKPQNLHQTPGLPMEYSPVSPVLSLPAFLFLFVYV